MIKMKRFGNKKYYIPVIFLLSIFIVLAVYHEGTEEKSREISYYITKEKGSCASENEKEAYVKHHIIQKDDMRTVFSEIWDDGRGSLTYVFIGKAVRYMFNEKGELTNKTILDFGDYGGYIWWGSYILLAKEVEVGDMWEGDVTIKSQNMEDQSPVVTQIVLHCRAEVLSCEKIKVKAGDFKCYKIKLTQEGEYKDNNENRSVKYTITLWYSPDLKIILKDTQRSLFGDFECTSTSELVEYR